MSNLRALSAEFRKLKYPPIYWLTAVVVFVMLAIVFVSHFLDPNSVVGLGDNPWRKMIVACNGIFFIFMAIPYVVLLVGAAIYIEHQSNAWKHLYVTPKHRMSIIVLKLISLLLCLLFTIVILSLGLLPCAYLLDFFLPELEFAYYPFLFEKLVITLSHSTIALLGVVGIQFFLAIRFKGFLLPACLGIVGFVLGIIMGSLNNPIATFNPYSYPLIVKDVNMFRIDKIGITEHGWLNSIEIYSIGIFLFFVILTLFLERKRSIT